MNYQVKAKQRRLIQKLKMALKKEKEFIEKCEKYDRRPNFIDDVKVSFQPLDVSAKTINGEIILNESLLEKDWVEQMRYLLHESTHVLQQEAGQVNGKVDKDNYLDDENEQEAFQAQISFQNKHEGPEEVQEYIENLLDHHDIKGKERKEKEKMLTEEVK